MATSPGQSKRAGKPTARNAKPDSKPRNKHVMKLIEHGKPPATKGKRTWESLAKSRFPERYKSGQLDRLTKGDVARKVRLDDQFRMHQKGDVARRLELHKRAINHGAFNITKAHNVVNVVNGVMHNVRVRHPYHHYRGRVSPGYVQNCFRFYNYGPRYFYHGPGVYVRSCWYPRWTRWVRWSWYFRCDPLWDPRPIWCRPIIYRPCRAWVWWPCPCWVALPETTCGTWVDIEPVEVGPKPDLQLLAVRFIDPGHPEEKLGPRYRVWLRNNRQEPLTQPFDVMLFASSDGPLAAGLPQSGVRVTAIEAGDTQSVDLRLPIEVYELGRDAAGKPVPFTMLHVLVDSGQEIDEASEANNGARLAQADILPVDPAAFEVDPRQPAAGAEVLMAGEGFGPEPGQVLLHMGGIEMEAEILGWYDLGVQVRLPDLPLAGPTEAELVGVRGADGAAANPLKITITPP